MHSYCLSIPCQRHRSARLLEEVGAPPVAEGTTLSNQSPALRLVHIHYQYRRIESWPVLSDVMKLLSGCLFKMYQHHGQTSMRTFSQVWAYQSSSQSSIWNHPPSILDKHTGRYASKLRRTTFIMHIQQVIGMAPCWMSAASWSIVVVAEGLPLLVSALPIWYCVDVFCLPTYCMLCDLHVPAAAAWWGTGRCCPIQLLSRRQFNKQFKCRVPGIIMTKHHNTPVGCYPQST